MTDALSSGPVVADPGPGRLLHVTPESAGWGSLEFSVVEVNADAEWRDQSDTRETAVVPLSGTGTVVVDGRRIDVARSSVFEELGRVVYVPPGVGYEIIGGDGLTVAVGSAPAEGRYPVRVIEPGDMRNEIRGGGAAYRQVIHTLAPPIPAEHSPNWLSMFGPPKSALTCRPSHRSCWMS